MNKHKKLSCIGPGGLKCSCCRPVRGGNKKVNKKFVNRFFRRKAKQNDSAAD